MATKTYLLITGGNTGIGLETVKAFLGSDVAYHIFLCGRSLEKAEAAVKSLESEFPQSKTILEPMQLDIEDDASIEKAYKKLESQPGYLDVLVNNAGAGFDAEIDSGKMTMREAWNKTYDVNVSGTQVLTHTFIPLLLKSSNPRLLFLTSGTSSLNNTSAGGNPNHRISPPKGWPKPPTYTIVAYQSSKTALNMLMLYYQRILKEDGVKVWCISPGFLATGLGLGDSKKLKDMGAGDPSLGGGFVRQVVEGERDADVGKVISRAGVQAW